MFISCVKNNSSPIALAQLLLYQSSPLEIDAIVRILPSKREVYKGHWAGQSVYAKKFLGEQAVKYAQRDATGVAHLQAAKILTPRLLHQGRVQDSQAQVLIFAEVADAQNAEQVYQLANFDQRIRLANSLVLAVAQHHNANLIQTDLYLKNFLVQGEKIYTLDGDGIRKYDQLSKRIALKNLSILLSKLDVLMLESHFSGMLDLYADARGWSNAPDVPGMQKIVSAYRRRIASRYAENKVFRTCTDVKVVHAKNIFVAVSNIFSSLNISLVPEQLDALIVSGKVIKNGRTCTVAATQCCDEKVVIKRYNIKSFWHGVNRALRQSRAAVSWANAHRLKLLDIATVKPVALIEERKFSLLGFSLRGKAYFLSEYIDAPDAAQFFAACDDKTSRADTIKNIATLFYKLYLLKISHGDTKATNIKIVNSQPVLIDLDSMTQHSFAFFALKAHARDLRRFMQNWQDDQALYNGFVKTFKVIYAEHLPLKMAGIL